MFSLFQTILWCHCFNLSSRTNARTNPFKSRWCDTSADGCIWRVCTQHTWILAIIRTRGRDVHTKAYFDPRTATTSFNSLPSPSVVACIRWHGCLVWEIGIGSWAVHSGNSWTNVIHNDKCQYAAVTGLSDACFSKQGHRNVTWCYTEGKILRLKFITVELWLTGIIQSVLSS